MWPEGSVIVSESRVCLCVCVCVCVRVRVCVMTTPGYFISYWLGVIRLLIALGDREAVVMTVLALGDVKLLTQPQPWGKWMQNVMQVCIYFFSVQAISLAAQRIG